MLDLFATDENVHAVERGPNSSNDAPLDSYNPETSIFADRRASEAVVGGIENVVEDEEFDFQEVRTLPRQTSPTDFSLGLDEEVVVKQKKVHAKLDDQRLLSDKGLPRLQSEVTQKLKFKGKGHEFSDLAKLVEAYQFWAHDLYPKAKFRDSIKMISKIGKTNVMKAHRRSLIDARLEALHSASSEHESVVNHRSLDVQGQEHAQVRPESVYDSDEMNIEIEMDTDTAINVKASAVYERSNNNDDIPDNPDELEDRPFEDDFPEDFDALEAMGATF